jgi:thioesterase domain-containing protein
MASTLNAFELLQQAGGLPSGNKTKKKKNKKPAAAKEVDEAPAVQEQATRDAEIAPEATAVPILEKSARTFKTGGDRIKLWKDWIRQVRQQLAGGRGPLQPTVPTHLPTSLAILCRRLTAALRLSSTRQQMAA